MGLRTPIRGLLLAFLCGPILGLQIDNACTSNCSDHASPWVPIEECDRVCNGSPKNCYMKLHIERYTVMGPACGKCQEGVKEDCLHPQCVTADGFPRSVLTVNRKLPAPLIAVCVGDVLAVDIVNQMADLSTSIHWHGLRQRGSQYYDGTPFVTQCPIGPANTFRYIYTAQEEGSFFYHSHVGTQKLDGIAGGFVVRGQKENDIHSTLYDEDRSEHVIFVTDWTHIPAEHMTPGLHNSGIPQMLSTYLINGKGKYFNEKSNIDLPIEEFVVEEGKRFRFRLISGTCMTCGAELTIEGHDMLAIAADGGLTFEPTLVKSILFAPADRFDVIINATKPGGVYKVHVKGVGPGCESFSQYAILRYKDSVRGPLPYPTPPSNELGVVLNENVRSPNCPGLSDTELCISQMKGTSNAPRITDPDLYSQIVLGLAFTSLSPKELFDEGKFISYDEPFYGLYLKMTVNKISFMVPPSPFLSQYDDIPKDIFCSEDCMRGNISTYCSCPALYSVKLNSVVDIIITDDDQVLAHPFHLHGFNFYILEMGGEVNLTAKVAELKEKLRRDEISLENKPMKDTVSIPYGGYAVLRFVADNPGYWIFHCHFAFHLENGMAGVLGVGERSDLPPIPQNFPRCGNFLPSL